MKNQDDIIRKLAHQLWEAEGKPDGQAEKHWQKATALAQEKNNSNDGNLKRSVDPSEATGPTEPEQPDQT